MPGAGTAAEYPGAVGRLPAQYPQPSFGSDQTPLPSMLPNRPSSVPPGPPQVGSPPAATHAAPAGQFQAGPPSTVSTAAELPNPGRPMAPSAAPAPPRVQAPPNLAQANAPTMFKMADGSSGLGAPSPAAASPAAPQAMPNAPTPVPSTAQASAPHVGGAAVVVVKRDGSEGERFSLAGGQLVIGRTQGDIRFPPDTFISPNHARLVRHQNGVELVDLDSRNGVYVRILDPQGVYPGDHFLLGHQLMRLDALNDTPPEQGPDAHGVRVFGTPLDPAWGRLVLIGVGGVPSDAYYLRGAQTVFGRETGDILFPGDTFLSRRHARLRMELRGGNMVVMLEDLGSANGTYLRLRGSAMLGEGDMFRVGDQLFRVRGIG